VEKFRTWSDCEGEVERCFTKDEMLTNIMLYWTTGTINAAFWPYYSTRHGDWNFLLARAFRPPQPISGIEQMQKGQKPFILR
jgi:hypothetical protein